MRALSLCSGTVCVGLLLAGCAPTPRDGEVSAATTGVGTDAVSFWNQTALDVAPNPVGGIVVVAMANLAMYNAVNAIVGGYTPYGTAVTADPGADPEAAAAVAAHDVLMNDWPFMGFAIEPALDASLAAIADGPAKDAGIAVGHAAAQAMIADRDGDGRHGLFTDYATAGGPGDWVPTPPDYGSAAIPGLANVRPFAMTSPSQFRAPPPLSLTSKEYALDFNETKSMGSATSTVRTADQTDTAIFWTEPAPYMWNRVARGISADRGDSLVAKARLLGLVSLAGADAFIGCWDSKYHYGFWRPITAIREGDIDGNPRTVADAGWNPLLDTLPFPEYVSAHSCYSSAMATVIADVIGTDNITVTVESAALPGKPHTYDRLSDAVREVADARVFAGLHFRQATIQGGTLGRKAARQADRNYLLPAN